jgi:threonine/homoserine/homoserine lactone efflux protein
MLQTAKSRTDSLTAPSAHRERFYVLLCIIGTLVAFRQGLLNNLLNPKAGAIFCLNLPVQAILPCWLNLYAFLVSRAGQSRFGTRVHDILQGVTGVVLIALGVRLAFEQK